MYIRRYRRKAAKPVRRSRKSARVSYKRRRPARASALVSAVKRIVRNTAETKSARATSSIVNAIHRDFYYVTPFTLVGTGVTDAFKVGNSIYVKGVSLRFNLIRSNSFYNDIKIRIVAFYNPRNEIDTSELTQTNWASGSTTVMPNLFFQEGTNMEYIRYDWLGIKPIYDRTIIHKSNNFGSTVANVTQGVVPYRCWIPINSVIKYQDKVSTSSSVPIKNLILCMYIYGGGLTSSDLNVLYSTINTEHRVYFKDDC